MSVKWSELYRRSVVEVEFGTPKKYVEAPIDCVDLMGKYPYGINTDNEFSMRHMAIVISKNLANSAIIVVPLTETKHGDAENLSRVVLEHQKYKYFLYKDTTILIDNIVTIEKKVRIKKIVLQWVPEPVRRKIKKVMYESFK
ncbi:MAG: type II toxin-antitoxin system PemK/MazF family toxin [Sulfuricurvum sp.]